MVAMACVHLLHKHYTVRFDSILRFQRFYLASGFLHCSNLKLLTSAALLRSVHTIPVATKSDFSEVTTPEGFVEGASLQFRRVFHTGKFTKRTFSYFEPTAVSICYDHLQIFFSFRKVVWGF